MKYTSITSTSATFLFLAFFALYPSHGQGAASYFRFGTYVDGAKKCAQHIFSVNGAKDIACCYVASLAVSLINEIGRAVIVKSLMDKQTVNICIGSGFKKKISLIHGLSLGGIYMPKYNGVGIWCGQHYIDPKTRACAAFTGSTCELLAIWGALSLIGESQLPITRYFMCARNLKNTYSCFLSLCKLFDATI